MTPDELFDCIRRLHWTLPTLGGVLRMSERYVRRMAKGEAGVPEDVAAWLRRRAQAMIDDPPPHKPRERE